MSNIWLSFAWTDERVTGRPGYAAKYFGEDWHEFSDQRPRSSKEQLDNVKSADRGARLSRRDFPEALAIWDERKFMRNTKEFFWVNGFMAVKGRLAKLLQSAEFGNGYELLPIPIFQNDKTTPYPVDAFFLNWLGPVDNLRPESATDGSLSPVFPPSTFKKRPDLKQLWKYGIKDIDHDDVAVGTSALNGLDVWREETFSQATFFSNSMKEAIDAEKIKLGVVKWDFLRCRIVD